MRRDRRDHLPAATSGKQNQTARSSPRLRFLQVSKMWGPRRWWTGVPTIQGAIPFVSGLKTTNQRGLAFISDPMEKPSPEVATVRTGF
jgi:hypothetical protein